MSFKNEDLIAVCQRTMPFGKYQGRPLIDLPEIKQIDQAAGAVLG